MILINKIISSQSKITLLKFNFALLNLPPPTKFWPLLISKNSGCHETPKYPGGKSETLWCSRYQRPKLAKKVVKNCYWYNVSSEKSRWRSQTSIGGFGKLARPVDLHCTRRTFLRHFRQLRIPISRASKRFKPSPWVFRGFSAAVFFYRKSGQKLV